MQHYRVDLQEAIHLYKSGDLTAKGAIKLWVRIKFKPGWDAFIDTKELRVIFGMARSTFWDAMDKLQEEGEIHISEPNKLYIKRLSISSGKPDSVRKTGQSSEKPDSHPENRTVIRKTGQSSEKPDEGDSESLLEEESPKHHISSDSFQIFTDSLSQEERESFYKFGEEKAKQLPKPPALTRKWIEKNWEAIKAEWKPVTTQSLINWETDPRTPGWFEEVYKTNNPLEFAAGNEEKMAFIEWAYENDKWEWEWKQ